MVGGIDSIGRGVSNFSLLGTASPIADSGQKFLDIYRDLSQTFKAQVSKLEAHPEIPGAFYHVDNPQSMFMGQPQTSNLA